MKSSISISNSSIWTKLFPFLRWRPLITSDALKADLFAGLTGAFIVLPQGVSFAMIAGLPSEFGLYTAMIPTIVAALFGSSYHLISGPTTAISIIVFSTISPLAEPGTPEYIRLTLTLTFIAGIYQVAFGFARLGTLINFVSHSVVVGFTAGAAILIATGQLKHALGIHIPSGASFIKTWVYIFKSVGHINGVELIIAVSTLATAGILKHYFPKFPGLLIAMIFGSVICMILDGANHGVRFLGSLKAQLPPLSSPDFDPDTLRILAPGGLAVALLALIEALSIARSIAVMSNQHINGNQEFIGQGLSNIIGSFFSSYAGSGSFTRSGINYQAGAVTPLAGIFSAIFLAMIVLLVAPLTAYLPLSAMGGIILIVAFKLIDIHHIREIIKSSKSETTVLAVTLAGTLFFQLEFAIYAGVLLSLAFYLTRTSHPYIRVLAPNPNDPRRRLTDIEEINLNECPQLKIVRIEGSIFFGAANHVAEGLEKVDTDAPKYLLIVGVGINFVDVTGAILLTQEALRRRKFKKDLFLCRINHHVLEFLERGEYLKIIGSDHVFPTEFSAISSIFQYLDKTICSQCQFRIFEECQKI